LPRGQCSYWFRLAGQPYVRVELSQWREYKGTFGDPWMRDREVPRVEHQIVVQQDVEIDLAWPPAA
jgi:hypothetical protein